MNESNSSVSLNKQVATWLGTIFSTLLLILTALTPLFFWNLTSEFFETPKFILLIIITSLLLIIWSLRFVVVGRVTFTRTPLDLPLILLLVVFIVSTFFSDTRWISIYGNLPRINGGLASIISYVLLYFVLVSNLKQPGLVQKVFYVLLAVGTLLAGCSLIHYAGQSIINLPFTKGLNFTPTGSSFSNAAILVLLLPFTLLEILKSEKSQIITKVVFSVLLTLFAVTIILTGTVPIYIAAAIALILTFFIFPPVRANINLPFLVLPFIIAVTVALLVFIPLGGSKNLLYAQAQKFPKEIQLPLTTSWNISVSAFRDSPLWGSGPATYLPNFTTYKPIEFNNTKIWSVRFDQAFNEYLQLLATTGITGLAVFLLMTVIFISLALKAIKSNHDTLGSSLAISGILFFVLLALHASTVVVWVIGLIILASFMAKQKELTEDINIGIAATKHSDNQVHFRFDALPGVLFIIFSLFVGVSMFFAGKSIFADISHRKALNAVAAGQGLEAYNHLVSAESLSPMVDLYRTDLAQTNFALANAIATNKGPSQASPSGSLTDQDKQNIQTLLSQAINEGKAAVTLNPNNPANWEVLGSIYRQISGVAQNALAFSLDSYGRAIQKDPLNPTLRLTVGGIYYSAGNYEMAIRFFTDAINLKSDYANAYYNLSIALREKGDLKTAVAAAEKTVSLIEPSSQDYQMASDLLASLKDKEKAQTEESAGQELGKASKTGSALENKKLPKLPVQGLEQKPTNIATPEAVKKE